MSWLTNFVRPKLRALGIKPDVPDNLWIKCPDCEQMLFHRELAANLHVCHYCDHHLRLPAADRLAMLFDDGTFQTIELPETIADPLRFRDRRRYSERLRDARHGDDRRDAVLVGHGTMGGHPAVVAAFDFGFMGGSMGVAAGEGLLAAANLAVLQDSPLIVVPASGGARMQEGILSLMQLPRTVIGVQQVREAGLPYIVVLADPTTGGVTASFAMLGDIALAEPGAIVGFAGTRVIQETIREKLPTGFQRAEYLHEHGMVDMVVHRRALRDRLISLIGLLRHPRPKAEFVPLERRGEAADETSDKAPQDKADARAAPAADPKGSPAKGA
jgi:acetyl-CoA carboxylase carboxyl transferase subunit beta